MSVFSSGRCWSREPRAEDYQDEMEVGDIYRINYANHYRTTKRGEDSGDERKERGRTGLLCSPTTEASTAMTPTGMRTGQSSGLREAYST